MIICGMLSLHCVEYTDLLHAKGKGNRKYVLWNFPILKREKSRSKVILTFD